MKISEILRLTAAGFKASEIRAFMEDEKKDETPAQEPTPDPAPAPAQEPTSDPVPAPALAEEKDMKPDFEALYNKTLEELTHTQEKLAAAQAENRNRGVVNPIPTLEDEFKKAQELFRR